MDFIRFFFTKQFLKHLVAAFGVGLALLFALHFGLSKITAHNQYVIVPDLEGFSISDIQVLEDQVDFRFAVLDSTKFNPQYPPLSVIEHVPSAGAEVKKDRKIYLTLNPSGYRKLRVPNVVQVTRRNAETKLTAVGFELGEITYRNNIGKNMVLEMRYKGQKIEAGRLLPKTSKIDLVLGNGKR